MARSMEPLTATEQAAQLRVRVLEPLPSCFCGQTPTTTLKTTWILNQPFLRLRFSRLTDNLAKQILFSEGETLVTV